MKSRREIPMEVVFLEEGTIHLLVEVVALDVENLWWVVDTGASKSVVDRALASSFVGDQVVGSPATGLGKEMVETSTGFISNLILGGFSFDTLQVAIVDLHHINEEYAKYSDKRIAGLLGSDFFFREKALVDYEARILSLRDEVAQEVH
jgi:Aspartyl protease